MLAPPLIMLDWYGLMSVRADLRRCNRCSEPFVTRRARRQDHGQDCSEGRGLSFISPLMGLHVHDLPATPLHGLQCQGDWQNTDSESDWTGCDATYRSTCVS